MSAFALQATASTSRAGVATEIRCFPRADASFADLVRQLLDGTDATNDALHAVLGTLRERYPNAIIVRQSSLAVEGVPVVYVYRDGHVVEPIEPVTT